MTAYDEPTQVDPLDPEYLIRTLLERKQGNFDDPEFCVLVDKVRDYHAQSLAAYMSGSNPVASLIAAQGSLHGLAHLLFEAGRQYEIAKRIQEMPQWSLPPGEEGEK